MKKGQVVRARLEDNHLRVTWIDGSETKDFYYDYISNAYFRIDRSVVKEEMPDGKTVELKPGSKTQIMLVFEIDEDQKGVAEAMEAFPILRDVDLPVDEVTMQALKKAAGERGESVQETLSKALRSLWDEVKDEEAKDPQA